MSSKMCTETGLQLKQISPTGQKNMWIILATTQIMNDTLALSKPKRFRTDRKFNTGDANAIVFVLMKLFLNRKIL